MATIDPPAVTGRRPAPQRIHDPATDELVAEVAQADDHAASRALRELAEAAPRWRDRPAGDRAAGLRAWSRALAEHEEELARLVTRETGRPLREALAGVRAGVEGVAQYAELGLGHRGRRLLGDPDADDVMEPRALGVALVLLPWNDPVALAASQLAACLVTGNVVLVKPSERAPLAVAWAVDLLPEALRPAVRLLQGDGRLGARLVADPAVDVVLHTGAIETGQAIAATSARHLRRTILELGGNDPLVVDGDVDPGWAAAQAASGAFANAGQLCTAVERIVVHRRVAGPFLEHLVRRAEALRPGPPEDRRTTLGPLVDRRHRAMVHGHVQGALASGAVARTGGVVPDGPGCFYPPTVLTEVRPEMAVWATETFGPVAPVIVVDDVEEGLALAAEGRHGLAATVLTTSDCTAREAARRLDVGTLKINAVFGGAPAGAAEPRRHSGLGTGFGPELLDELTSWRVVHRCAATTR
jgi:succinate-semialdehyde dehydrogenase/glutarate-semialdehyde dehydrogenase